MPINYTSNPRSITGARSVRRGLALLAVGALALAACGSDPEPAAAPAAAAEAAPAAGAVVSTASSEAGDILVDANGLSLYGFTPDEAGAPTCGGACADAWPPVILDSAEVPAGLDTNVFSTVEGIDGGFQLKAGKWPLYTFAGDGAPGDINGQGSGDSWFLAAPDGSLVRGDGEGAAPAPAPETAPASDESTDDGYDY